MSSQYVLAIDQSTQGTKAILFDKDGAIVSRADRPHKQLVNEKGWVSHDLEEIWQNTLAVAADVIEQSGIRKEHVVCLGISNQRETSCAWDARTGEPLEHAVVWQCARAEEVCERIRNNVVLPAEPEERFGGSVADAIRYKTGMNLSPYFPAAKFAWLRENCREVRKAGQEGRLCLGTVDSYLVYRLTDGRMFATDYSNASRTQLFNIETLEWDADICRWFGIDTAWLPEVRDSGCNYGETTLGGYLSKPVPILGVIGDSQGALFGQGCVSKGMVKATYGTGSSVMMNVGGEPVRSGHGLVTSLGWGLDGEVTYVLEGNINYSGAVITWLKDDMQLIQSPGETQEMAEAANPKDRTYLVPAFTGLGAPYWKPDARAVITGMSRTTGRNEIVKAALESIGYQIADIVNAMTEEDGIDVTTLCVDGGPTGNPYLMKFQSDILGINVRLPRCEEASAQGAAYMAGITQGVYDINEIFDTGRRQEYIPAMTADRREELYAGWKQAVRRAVGNV